MLDPISRLEFAGLPFVVLYRDSEQADLFYAVPTAPRVARDEKGQPDVSLVLYGHKDSAGKLQVSGGYLTVTTFLSITDGQRQAVLSALKKSNPQSQPVRLATPDWLDGEAQLEINSGLTASGKPSLMGDNQVAFSVQLSAEQARALQSEWEKGNSALRLSYQMHVRAAKVAQQQQEIHSQAESSTPPGAQSAAHEHFSFSMKQTSAAPLAVKASGSLDLGAEDTRSALKVIGL